MTRRDFIAASGASAASVVSAAAMAAAPVPRGAPFGPSPSPSDDPAAPLARELKGTLKQSVCQWCFGGMPLDDLCREGKAMGLKSVELLGPEQWPTLEKYGLTCAVATMVKANPIGRGFNRVEHHDSIIKDLEARLPLVKKANIPAQIVFSGNRAGLDDKQGLENCAKGLKRITPLAEDLGITIVMELLNSKVDHGDYMCDRTPWGAELVKQVGSPRFKLLYDIYHMQIMEGDVIRTITDHKDAIGHYHTAGVPGRNEIDATQELQYPAICAAILKTGYTGYLGQEFMPKRDPMKSLRQAVEICDV